MYSRIVAGDQSATAVVITLDHGSGDFAPKAALVRELRELAGELAGEREVWLGGGPVIDERMYQNSENDTLMFAPIVSLLLMGALIWLFRSPIAVVVPLGVVGGSVLWSVGFMSWMGWPANVVTVVLPPVLMAVGVADSIHLLQQLRLFLRQGIPPREALRKAFVKVWRPCLLTTVTTAAGMASLSLASLSGIQELGLTAAFGVVAAFVLTMGAVPMALRFVPERWLAGLATERSTVTPKLLVSMARASMNNRAAVLIGTAVVTLVAVVGITRIDVGSSMVSYFYESEPIYQELLRIDRDYGGSMPFEVLVEANTEDPEDNLLEPERLEAIQRVAALLGSQPAAGRPLSFVDFLVEARRVLRQQPVGELALPASRAEAAQILLFTEGQGEIERFVTADYQVARIEVPVEASRYEELTDRLIGNEAMLAEAAGPSISVKVTGLSRLLADMEVYLIDSQIKTFGTAFGLVIACIALLFWSIRAGLLSALPNLLPLVLMLGLMGWVGVPLDLTTVMVAPMLLGLVVDDTVHVLERVLTAREEGATVRGSFLTSVEEVGHAVMLTSIVLIAGFVTPVMGSFKPHMSFALLSVAAIVLALLADVVVLPALGATLPWLVPGKRDDAG
jgi:predicted RND superfamily exporter protein